MKNFATYVDKKMIKKIIDAYDLGIVGNAIDAEILSELSSLNEAYLPDLHCSDECKNFIDQFLGDVDEFKMTGKGSNFSRNYAEAVDTELTDLRKTFDGKKMMYAPENFKCESEYAKEGSSNCDCGESRCYFFELEDQKLHKVVCCDVCYNDAPASEKFI